MDKEFAEAFKEEIELDEMKWAVGGVYHQEFKNGDRVYFRADSVQKNKRWKGMSVDEFGGRQKKPKNVSADEKQQGWVTTPKNEIPKGLKEDVDLIEGTALQVKMALDDVGLKGKWKNNKVYVKKRDVEKAEKALKGNVIYRGKPPVVVGEEIEEAHKVECPKCKGEGCEHCDGKGYHIKEAKGTAFPATVDTLRKIVKDKQHQTVMFKSGQALVDLFTASAMVQVYDALKKPEMKKHFEKMITDKAGFLKTQAFAMKMIGK